MKFKQRSFGSVLTFGFTYKNWFALSRDLRCNNVIAAIFNHVMSHCHVSVFVRISVYIIGFGSQISMKTFYSRVG